MQFSFTCILQALLDLFFDLEIVHVHGGPKIERFYTTLRVLPRLNVV